MKKIINVKRYPVIVDTETIDIKALPEEERAVDSIYIVPEDCMIHWEQKDKDPIDTSANKGDLIVTFYNKSFNREMIVVKSEDWKNLLDQYKVDEQKRKEEWALKCKDTCRDCECGVYNKL